MSIADRIDNMVTKLENKYGDFENMSNQIGLTNLYDKGHDILQSHCPQTASAVDKMFGAAKVALDSNGNGHIDFSELAAPIKDLVGMKKAVQPQQTLDPAKQFELELRLAMIQCQMQIMAAPWTGFGNNTSNVNPFLLPLQTAILKTFDYALKQP